MVRPWTLDLCVKINLFRKLPVERPPLKALFLQLAPRPEKEGSRRVEIDVAPSDSERNSHWSAIDGEKEMIRQGALDGMNVSSWRPSV